MNALGSPLAALCGLAPSKILASESELGITAEQLEQLLVAATNTSNYHTRPPPSEDRSHDRRSVEKFRLTCLAPSSLSTSSSSSAASSLCKAGGPVPAIHIGVWLRAYMQGSETITGEVLTELVDMCLSNEPEWVHKVQQTALAVLLALMESKGDTYALHKFVGPILSVPTSMGSTSSSIDDIAILSQLKHHPIVTGSHFALTSSSTQAGQGVGTPTNASPSMASSPSSVGGVPEVVVSCPHFRFILEGGGSGDVELSAQVRISNAGRTPFSVRIAQEITFLDGQLVNSPTSKGDSRNLDNSSSSSLSPLSSSPRANPFDPLKNMDIQILLERSYLKKTESSRLLISLVAKNAQQLLFKTYHKVLILVLQESVKVVVTLAVINPRQSPFGTSMPSAISQPVVESPLGSYEAPILLQVIKHHFQIMGGFGWREVGNMLSTHAIHPAQHTHNVARGGALEEDSLGGPISNKVMAEAVVLKKRLCQEWPCSALLPKLWSHALNGSQLTSTVFGVPAPPPGIAPSPTNASDVHFTSATSSTLKQRASVPVSCCSPIGYTPGSVRPAAMGSTNGAGVSSSSGGGTMSTAVGNDSATSSPTSSELQLLTMSALRIDCLMAAQPQTLFALILLWFAEFPVPILDRSLTMCDPCVYLDTMQPALQHLMVWLIDFCCGLLLHSECNGANIRNLALTFAPLLMDHKRQASEQNTQIGPLQRQQDVVTTNADPQKPSTVGLQVEEPRRQVSTSSPIDFLQNTATPQRPNRPIPGQATTVEGKHVPASPTSMDQEVLSSAFKEYNIGRGYSMHFNYEEVSNAMQQQQQHQVGTGQSSPQDDHQQPSLSLFAQNDSTPCFREPESSLIVTRLSEGYEPLPLQSTSAEPSTATTMGASAATGVSYNTSSGPNPASIPKDALANDVTLQLHCTTALIHWIKKYQPLYRKATGGPSSTSPGLTATTSKGAGENGTLSPRPLSPQTQSL